MTILTWRKLEMPIQELVDFYHEWGFRDQRGKLIKYLGKWKNRIRHKDYDMFIVVVGKERRGKSTFAAILANWFADGKLRKDASQFCMDANEFMEGLNSAQKGDPVIFDEAGTNLYSREAMSYINRRLTKAFMVSGLKNVVIILCIPNFFALDSYIRTHRIDLLFYIKDRGNFKAYSSERAKKISIYGAREKKMEVTRCNVAGKFAKTFPAYVEKAYRLKERAFKLRFLKAKDPRDTMLTLQEVAKVTGQAELTVFKDIQKERLMAQKYNSRWYISQEECDAYIARKHLMKIEAEA
jgi:hypothetical protein